MFRKRKAVGMTVAVAVLVAAAVEGEREKMSERDC